MGGVGDFFFGTGISSWLGISDGNESDGCEEILSGCEGFGEGSELS